MNHKEINKLLWYKLRKPFVKCDLDMVIINKVIQIYVVLNKFLGINVETSNIYSTILLPIIFHAQLFNKLLWLLDNFGSQK